MQQNNQKRAFLERLPSSVGTIFLVTCLIIIYIACMLLYPYNLFVQSPEVLQLFGENERVLRGEPYRIFSAIFIHASVVHLASNILFLTIFGIRLEELKSTPIVISVFIVSGLIGNLASIIWFLVEFPINSVGSSGAVFGLLGGIYFILRGKTKHERRKALYFLVIFFLITIGQDINFIAHFFGLLGGISFLWLDHKYREITN
ncbi:MAG: rhomboid family intramembrane serine protease [Candidatus Hodarchaeota archaeon]